ncbi:MAG: YceI family protein [Sphingobacteriales bacterium]
MKKITLLAAVLLTGTALFAQTKWNVDKAHAKIGFTVTHMMLSDVDGNFKTFDATLTSSKDDLSDAVFEITIEAASVNTDNEMRDNDVKGDHFFDVAKYPLITFKSTSINKIDGKKYKLTGNLTLHGVTKIVTLDLVFNGVGNSMMTHKPVAGFKVTGTINRTNFGVGSIPAAIVSEEIELRANGEFDQ